MKRGQRPAYSASEVRIFIDLYVAMAKRPITISASQLHAATGLSMTHCQELIEEIDADENLTTERLERGISIVPDRYIKHVMKQEAKPKAEYDPNRVYPHQVDEILKHIKAKHPKFKFSKGERHALVSLTKDYGFARVETLVMFAMESDFWQKRVKSAFDLYKISQNTGKSYIDTIAIAYEQDADDNKFKSHALV